jgi:hypothetical protein
LQKPRRFKSWLENAVSGLTIPAHPNVRHATLSGDNAAEGFVVTCIAKSHLAPHQCIRPPQYYMRAGVELHARTACSTRRYVRPATAPRHLPHVAGTASSPPPKWNREI